MEKIESLRKARDTRSIIARLGRVLKGKELEEAINAVKGIKQEPVKMPKDLIKRLEYLAADGPQVVVKCDSFKMPWKIYTYSGYKKICEHLQKLADARQKSNENPEPAIP